MVGDMENLKIRVTTEQESKEVQELFFELGYGWHGKGKLISYLDKILSDDFGWLVLWKPSYLTNTVIQMGSGFDSCKEITIQYLRDLVVLKRNSIDDATHTDQDGWKWYIGDDSYVWQAGNAHQLKQWDQSSLAMVDLKPIKKLVDKEVKMKEYIANVSGDWRLVDSHELVSGRIEVPEGAEFLTGLINERLSQVFWKPSAGEVYQDGRFKPYVFHGSISYEEYKSRWINNCVLWQRSPTTLDSKDTTIQDKLKFIEKWLTGEKIQYILGVESDKIQSEKTQWHNFTEGAMQYIKRSDIKFREAPKYVTINGIKFKSVESLLKYVKNNFDL